MEHATALCRDCLTAWSGAGRCPSCRSPRALRHAELGALAIAHVDCDAFYASVEKRDNPELRDVPLIVGGGTRGVVTTACYLARIRGVKSAMPMFQARKLCPQAVIVKPRMAHYVAVSREIRAMQEALTPLVEPLSLDEAFLDLSGTERLHGMPPAALLVRLQNRIEAEIGVTVSVGLSHNKFLAKIASDLDKPRGFAVIGRAETRDFLARQPIGVLWGVGSATRRALEADGIRTIGDLRLRERKYLIERFGALGDPTSKLAYATALPAATAQEAALRGDVALARGDTKRALFEYLQALQLGGADPGILYTVAKIHLLREDRARAELALKMVLNVQPEHAGANLELGVLCVHRREFETAESYLRRSLDEAEVNPRANNAMGVINDVKGDHAAARLHFEKAIAAAAQEPTYKNNLAYSYYLDGNLQMAEKWFRQALMQKPDYSRAWRNLGLVYARTSRYQEALEAFGKIENVYEAYNDIGYIAMVNERYDDAQRFFEEAIRLSPIYYELAGRNAERLGVMRGTAPAVR